MLQVINSKMVVNGETVPVPLDTIAADLSRIRRISAQMDKKEALWSFFGGIINVENREYQIIP